MDGFEKGLLAIGSFFALLLFALFAAIAYGGYLRAQMIAAAPDPLYAACAYDSSSSAVPASCYTLLSLNKDLPQ
jgi:hypothetical protein